jgi:hypothetical protein
MKSNLPASPSPAAPTTGLVCPVCLSPVSEPWSCAPCSAKYGTQPAIPAPCPSASWLPAPSGVSDPAPITLRGPDWKAPAPVSPSLPEFTERAGFPWHSTGTEIRRADNDAIASIHFATPSNRSLPSINEAEKLAKLICETLASHATLKADVERLTGALKAVLEIADASKLHGAETAATVSSLVRLSLAEVGKH